MSLFGSKGLFGSSGLSGSSGIFGSSNTDVIKTMASANAGAITGISNKLSRDTKLKLDNTATATLQKLQTATTIDDIMKMSSKAISDIKFTQMQVDTDATQKINDILKDVEDGTAYIGKISFEGGTKISTEAAEEAIAQLKGSSIAAMKAIENTVLGIQKIADLNKTKIEQVTLSKLELEALKKSGVTAGTVVIGKTTLPEKGLYYKTTDLQKIPNFLNSLLASGKVTKAELESGGVESKKIMSSYLDYLSNNPGGETLTPVMRQVTTTKEAEIYEKKPATFDAATFGITKEQTKGTYDTKDIFGITPATFDKEKKTETFSPSEYYWATSTKEGLKVGKVSYDGYERTGVGERGTLVKGDILNTLESEGKIDSKNWIVVSEGTKLGEHYRLNEISNTGQLLAHSVSAQVYGGESKPSTIDTITLKRITDTGGVREVKITQTELRNNLEKYEVQGYDTSEMKAAMKAEEDAQLKLDKYNTSIAALQGIQAKELKTEQKALSITDGNIKVYGKDVSSAVVPESYTIKDWTSMGESIKSVSPDPLKSSVSTIFGFFQDRDTKLAGAGLGTQSIVDTKYTGDWSMGKVLTFLGRELQSVSQNVLEGSKIISPDVALNGVYEFKVGEEGIKAANAWGTQWASNGKITNGIGLSDEDAKTFVLENAGTSTLSEILNKQGYDLAKLAYNPLTKASVIDALGSDTTKEIQNKYTLSQKDIEDVNREIVITGVKEILNQRITGTPLDPLITIASGGIIGVEGKVVGRVSGKVLKATEAASDFGKFVREAKIVVPTSGGAVTISDVLAKTTISISPEMKTLKSTLFVPTTETGSVVKLMDSKIKTDAVKAISNDFSAATLSPIEARTFIKNLVNKDENTATATIAELLSIDKNEVSNVFETGIKISNLETTEKATELLKKANVRYTDESLKLANNIAKEAGEDVTLATKKLYDLGNEIGRLPVENMVNTALEQGTEHYNLLTNALEGLNRLDIKTSVAIPQGLPTGASKAISGAELELPTIMKEGLAIKIQDLGGITQLRKVNDIVDMAKLSGDEIRFISTELQVPKEEIEKYVNKAIDALMPDMGNKVTTIEDYTTKVLKEQYKKWDTKEELTLKNLGIKQGESGEIVIDAKKIYEMDNKLFNFVLERDDEVIATALKGTPIETILKAEIQDDKKRRLITQFYDVLKQPEKKIETTIGKETLLDAVEKAKSGPKKVSPEQIIAKANEMELQTKLVPGKISQKEATINALEKLKNGDIENAAKELAKSKSYKKTELLTGTDIERYADTSTQKLSMMIEKGAPEDLVKQMIKERSNYALKKLAGKSDEMKRIAFKISNGDELTEAERLAIWNNHKELGIDAINDIVNKENPNYLIKGLKDDAIKSGNTARMKNLAEEMKKTKEELIKKGECIQGSKSGMIAGAAILGGTAIIGGAEGRNTFYDEKTDTYYTTSLEKVGHEKGIPGLAAQAWNALVIEGITNRKYSFGNVAGVQGKDIDETEYICQNFAMDAANFLQSKGYNAWAVVVHGYYKDGTPVSHAIIAIEDKSNMSTFVLNPTDGLSLKGETNEEKNTRIANAYKTLGNFTPIQTSGEKVEINVGDMTLMEPRTGETRKTGIYIAGKEMVMDGNPYEITDAILLGGEIAQRKGAYDTHKTYVDLYSKSNMLLDTDNSPEIEKLAPITEETPRELENVPEIETIKPD